MRSADRVPTKSTSSTLPSQDGFSADPEWLKIIREGYGTEPRITYYDVKLVVDNIKGQIYTGSEAVTKR